MTMSSQYTISITRVAKCTCDRKSSVICSAIRSRRKMEFISHFHFDLREEKRNGLLLCWGGCGEKKIHIPKSVCSFVTMSKFNKIILKKKWVWPRY